LISTLDAILGDHSAALGSDATPYRNHAYRVANLCLAQSSSSAESLEKTAIAAAFHDLGIWTDHTFDYLAPSVRLAIR
jgi:HD superfamily phosphohydrolase YqeK